MRRNTLYALGVVVLILAAMVAKSLLLPVPPVHSGPGQFDANRAKARLVFILGGHIRLTVQPTTRFARD
jgi:hypothetical protein